MTHTHYDDASATKRQLELGLEHTRRLGASRLHGQYTPEWYVEASYVGDRTALAALTLLTRVEPTRRRSDR